MNNFIRTGLLHLNLDSINFDVAHIYEHLLIETFKRTLKDYEISEYLYGWIGGETFHDVLFIEYGFYDPKVEQIFLDFMRSNPRIDYNLFDTELERIQAEDTSIITSIDKNAVLALLNELDQLAFTNHQRDDFQPTQIRTPGNNSNPEIIAMKRAKKQFREIAISFGIESTVLQDTLLLQRFRPIILDVIDSCLFKMEAYANAVSLTASIPGTTITFVTSIYTIRRGKFTLKQINQEIQNNLKKLAVDIKKQPNQIEHYAAGFLTTPNWHSFPIDYYRYTGTIASKSSIAKLLTPEHMLALLGKIEIDVSWATPENHELINKYS